MTTCQVVNATINAGACRTPCFHLESVIGAVYRDVLIPVSSAGLAVMEAVIAWPRVLVGDERNTESRCGRKPVIGCDHRATAVARQHHIDRIRDGDVVPQRPGFGQQGLHLYATKRRSEQLVESHDGTLRSDDPGELETPQRPSDLGVVSLRHPHGARWQLRSKCRPDRSLEQELDAGRGIEHVAQGLPVAVLPHVADDFRSGTTKVDASDRRSRREPVSKINAGIVVDRNHNGISLGLNWALDHNERLPPSKSWPASRDVLRVHNETVRDESY